MDDPKPRCDEKIALLLEYQKLTHGYSIVIGHMVPRDLTMREYGNLSAAAEEARQAAATARERLDRHIAEHGC